MQGIAGAMEIYLDRVEIGLPGVLFGHRKRNDSGICQHKIDPPQLGVPGFERNAERIEISHVCLASDNTTTKRFDLLDSLLKILRNTHRIGNGFDLRTQIDSDDVGALAREPNRVTTTLSPRCARDESHLACQFFGHAHAPCVGTSLGLSPCGMACQRVCAESMVVERRRLCTRRPLDRGAPTTWEEGSWTATFMPPSGRFWPLPG